MAPNTLYQGVNSDLSRGLPVPPLPLSPPVTRGVITCGACVPPTAPGSSWASLAGEEALDSYPCSFSLSFSPLGSLEQIEAGTSLWSLQLSPSSLDMRVAVPIEGSHRLPGLLPLLARPVGLNA